MTPVVASRSTNAFVSMPFDAACRPHQSLPDSKGDRQVTLATRIGAISAIGGTAAVTGRKVGPCGDARSSRVPGEPWSGLRGIPGLWIGDPSIKRPYASSVQRRCVERHARSRQRAVRAVEMSGCVLTY